MDTATIENEPKRKIGNWQRKPKMSQAEKAKITKLREENKLSITDIAPIVGRSASSIWEYLERVNPDNKALQSFKGKEADTLSYTKSISRGVRIKLLESLSKESAEVFDGMTPDQKGALNQRLAIAEGIDTEKERLIRGLATIITGTDELISKEKEIDQAIEDLRKTIITNEDGTQDVVFMAESNTDTP